jgi:hypothetical protein
MSVRSRVVAAADMRVKRPSDDAERVASNVKRRKVAHPQTSSLPHLPTDSSASSTTHGKKAASYFTPHHAELSRRVWMPSSRECHYDARAKCVQGMNEVCGSIAGFNTLTLTAAKTRKAALAKAWARGSDRCTFPTSSIECEGTPKPSAAYYAARKKRWRKEGKSEADMDAANLAEKMARKEAETHVKTYIRSQKIELTVTSQQRVILMRWFNDARRTRNRALGYLTREHMDWILDENVSIASIKTHLRTKFVTAQQVRSDTDRRSWTHLLRTPADIRKAAIADLMDDIKRTRTNATKRKDLRAKYPTNRKFHTDVKFHVAFKSRHITHDSLNIESKSYKFVDGAHFGLFSTCRSYTRSMGNTTQIMKRIAIKAGKDAMHLSPATITSDFKLHYAYGRFYLLAPFKTRVAQTSADVDALPLVGVPDESDDGVDDAGSNNTSDVACTRHTDYCRAPESNHRRHTAAWLAANGPAKRETMLMCDPGVHTFLSGYSPQGTIELLATNSNVVIDKHLRRIDKWARAERHKRDTFVARAVAKTCCTLSRKDKAKVRVKLRRVRQRHVNARRKKQDCVRNLHYNLAHYVARKYQTIGLPFYSPSRKANRKIPVQVVRRQLALAYGKFVPIVKQVMALYPGGQTVRASEWGTTMQCGRCKWQNRSVGGDKVFRCGACAYRQPRDVHGARNFMLRTLVDGAQQS